MSPIFVLFLLLFIVVSVVMVLVVLAQRPQGGGLAAAFGGAGAGGTDTAFGGRTGDVLTYATIGCFIVYIAIAMGLNIGDDALTNPAAQEEAAATSTEPGGGAPAPTVTTTPVTDPNAPASGVSGSSTSVPIEVTPAGDGEG